MIHHKDTKTRSYKITRRRPLLNRATLGAGPDGPITLPPLAILEPSGLRL